MVEVAVGCVVGGGYVDVGGCGDVGGCIDGEVEGNG